MKKHLATAQWFCLCMTAILLVAACVGYFLNADTQEVSEYLVEKHKTGIGMLTADSPASQTFTTTMSGLKQLDVMFSNYNKKLKSGTLTLWVEDESGKEIARQTYQVSEKKNNAFLSLPLDTQPDAKTVLTLYAISDCTEQKGVTLRMGSVTGELPGTLTLADGTVDTEGNALYLRTVYEVKNYSTGWMTAVTLVLLSLCFLACVPLAARKEKPHA